MPRAKSKMARQILRKLLIGGAILVAAQSPYFWIPIYKNFFSGRPIFGKKKQFQNTFYYLKNKGLIRMEKKNKQIYVFLTKDGEWEAGKYQINELYIKPQKRWDGKWRVIIFDIPEVSRIKREAFRGKLKELGFYQLQKSVWVHPYPCREEIELLREFFGLDKRNLRILDVEKIEEDQFLRNIFNLEKSITV